MEHWSRGAGRKDGRSEGGEEGSRGETAGIGAVCGIVPRVSVGFGETGGIKRSEIDVCEAAKANGNVAVGLFSDDEGMDCL